MFKIIILAIFLFSSSITTAYRVSSTKNSHVLKMSFNLDKAVSTLTRNKILTKTSQLGLLSKLEKSGFTLTSAAPLLKFADENDLIGVLEASSEKVLPLIGTAIEFTPALLPVAGSVLNSSPVTLFAGAALSAVSAFAFVNVVPDDSVINVALQTIVAVPLGVILPGALGVGGLLLTKLK